MKKKEYYTTKVREAENKPKELFKIVNKLRDVKQDLILPISDSDLDLANKFLIFKG